MRAQSDYIGRWCVCVQSHAEWIEFGMGEDLYGRGGFMLSMGELYVPGVRVQFSGRYTTFHIWTHLNCWGRMCYREICSNAFLLGEITL